MISSESHRERPLGWLERTSIGLTVLSFVTATVLLATLLWGRDPYARDMGLGIALACLLPVPLLVGMVTCILLLQGDRGFWPFVAIVLGISPVFAAKLVVLLFGGAT